MALNNEFRFNLFQPELQNSLVACKYVNLPFDFPTVGSEINHLLTESAIVFFQSSKTSNIDSFKNALSNAKVALDFAWEKINTGHWKDVDIIWRDVYSLASIFKVLCMLVMKNTEALEIIKECDKGLLLGAPVMGNTLNKIAFKLSEILLKEEKHGLIKTETKHKKRKILSQDPILKFSVPEKQKITKEDFVQYFMEKNEPVIINGVISEWPALSSNSWSVDYFLEKTCYRTVPIEIGSKYTDENWTQKLMTMREFVENYIWNETGESNIGYLAQHNLFFQIPELKKDFNIPFYIDKEKFVDISIWFGPTGTVSPLHYDPKHNLFAQVLGSKYIRLYSKEQTSNVYGREDPLFYNTSEVDVENPDFNKFPLFKDAKYTECILKPGQLLYIPPECWHYVRSLNTSISLSFWW